MAGMMRLKDMARGSRGTAPRPKTTGNESSEFFRGSSDIDLAPQGVNEAKLAAARTAGQFTHIATSPLRRAKDTADIVAKANKQAGKPKVVRALAPWFLGQHEGHPVTPDRLADIADRIQNKPDEAVPGRGPRSTGDGESFNDFKNPLISHAQKEVQEHKPGERRLNVTHYRDIHAVKAWIKNGAKDDKSIDTEFMVSKGSRDEKPGNLFHLDPKTMKLTEAKDATKEGVYFLRHGATEWNEENEAVGPSPVSKPRSLKDMNQNPVQL